MKLLLPVILVIWSGLASAATNSSSRIPTTTVFGREYLSLEAWASTHKFSMAWAKPHEEVVVTSRWSKLEFKADSRRAVINDAAVHLSFPIAHYAGVAYITPLDVKTVLEPILYPPKDRTDKIKTICLDAGHGGKDPGNHEGSHLEKDYALLLAQELRRQLVDEGLKVIMTRTTDTYIDLEDRPAIARRAQADLFISLHYNTTALDSTAVHGIETYCLTPHGASSTSGGSENSPVYPGNSFDEKNMLLAYQLQKALTQQLGAEDRGVKRQRFVVLKPARMPAVLVEGGFMNNTAELKKIRDAGYRKKMARAITDAVLAYKKLIER